MPRFLVTVVRSESVAHTFPVDAPSEILAEARGLDEATSNHDFGRASEAEYSVERVIPPGVVADRVSCRIRDPGDHEG